MGSDEPSNAVLLERLSNLKEDVRDQNAVLRDFRDRLEAEMRRIGERHAQLEIRIAQNASDVRKVAADLVATMNAHGKKHDDEDVRGRWVVGTLIAAVAAAGSLGLGALLVR
ncbi:MAG TPA: hypothetical protein VMG99_08695 [Thermoplasmata archaeon]|nr:hypothetical protein [Thermoplasmata archaeon]